VNEVQRRSAHSRRENSDLLELVHQIPANHDLHSERQLRHVAARKRLHETIERSFATPAIVIFTRHAIEAERDMRNSITTLLNRTPHTIEVPAVSDEAGR